MCVSDCVCIGVEICYGEDCCVRNMLNGFVFVLRCSAFSITIYEP